MKKFAAILAAIMILAMLCGTIVPVAATEETPEDETVEFDSSLYDAAAEGELLYKLNFAGDDIWQPGDYVRTSTVTPDENDPTKCVYSGNVDARIHWGAPIVGLPLSGPTGDGSDDYYAYTIEFKTSREHKDSEGNCIDSMFGIYFDDCSSSGHGVYGYTYNFSLMNGTERLMGKYTFLSEGFTPQGINYDAEGADQTQASVQEYAIEINAYDETYKLFMKDSTGAWVCIQASEVGDVMSFNGTYLFPTLYAYNPQGEKPITVEYVNIYKGMILSGEELPEAPDASDDTTTAAQDTTTAAPADTTTAAPADTTTNAPAGDNTTAAPTVTTKAPESNGCGGFAVLPVSIVAILGLAVTVVVKKSI